MKPQSFCFRSIFDISEKTFRFLLWIVVGLWLTVLLSGWPSLPLNAIAPPTPTISQSAPTVDPLLQTGIQQFQLNKFEEAIATWEQALDLATTPETILTRTLILSNLSLAHQHSGEWEIAEQYLLESLTFFASQPENERSPLVWDYYAKTLNTKGWLQWRMGQQEQALRTWQQTTLAYQAANNISGVVGSQLNQAKILQKIGLSSQSMTQLNTTKVLLDSQPSSLVKVTGLHHLGNALRHSGKLEASVEILTEASHVLSEVQFEAEEDQSYKSAILLDLGNTKRTQWNRAVTLNLNDEIDTYRTEALAHYQTAIDLAADDLQIVQVQANQLSLMVEIYQLEPRQANNLQVTAHIFSLWQSFQSTLAELAPNQDSLEVQLNIANSLLSLKSKLPEESDHFTDITWLDLTTQLQEVVGKARSLHDTRSESLALGYLGHIYEVVSQRQELSQKRGQWSDAKRLTEEAIALAETVQAPDIQYRWVWQLGRILQHIDAQPSSDSAEGNDPIDSSNFSESSCQNRVLCAYNLAVKLLDDVRSDLLFIKSDIQFSFRDNVEPLYREYVDLLLQDTNPSPQKLRQVTELIDALQLAELENFLGCNINPTPLSEKVVDPTAAILYPVILSDRLEVILAYPESNIQSQQQFTRFSTPVKNTDVNRLALQFRRLSADPTSSDRPRLARASQLYNWMIKPARQTLTTETTTEIQTLVFVLDGSLRNLPMAALWDAENEQYLVDEYAIAIAPSLQLVDPSNMSRPIKMLAAGTTEALNNPLEDSKFIELPNVENEIETIATVLPADVLLNEEFTQETFIAEVQANEFSIIHIATHGLFSSDSARTFIAVPNADPESEKPDALFADELDVLLRDRSPNSQPLELLVLSACQTAQGDDRATLGIAGLSIRAGARSTLATLWSVYDEAAATMMAAFYQQLAESPTISRAKALQQAQLKVRNEFSFHHPSYWSPYIMVGNWL